MHSTNAELKQLVREALLGRPVHLPPPEVRRVVREQAGLSQKTLSEILQVTRPTVTRWELGTRSPQGELRRRYAEVLRELLKDDAA